MTEPHFVSDRHALYVGWVVGLAMKNGLPVRPVVDDDGNYTDRIELDLFDPGRRPVRFVVTFIVPPPPNDWEPS